MCFLLKPYGAPHSSSSPSFSNSPYLRVLLTTTSIAAIILLATTLSDGVYATMEHQHHHHHHHGGGGDPHAAHHHHQDLAGLTSHASRLAKPLCEMSATEIATEIHTVELACRLFVKAHKERHGDSRRVYGYGGNKWCAGQWVLPQDYTPEACDLIEDVERTSSRQTIVAGDTLHALLECTLDKYRHLEHHRPDIPQEQALSNKLALKRLGQTTRRELLDTIEDLEERKEVYNNQLHYHTLRNDWRNAIVARNELRVLTSASEEFLRLVVDHEGNVKSKHEIATEEIPSSDMEKRESIELLKKLFKRAAVFEHGADHIGEAIFVGNSLLARLHQVDEKFEALRYRHYHLRHSGDIGSGVRKLHTSLIPRIEHKVRELGDFLIRHQQAEATRHHQACNGSNKSVKSSIEDTEKLLATAVPKTLKKQLTPSELIATDPSRRSAFDAKRAALEKALPKQDRYYYSDLNLRAIKRKNLFADSYSRLRDISDREWKGANMYVTFAGEHGIDMGGLTREWFQLFSERMLDAEHELFTPTTSEHPPLVYTILEQPQSHATNKDSYFEVIGKFMAKAILSKQLLNCPLSRAIYKSILGEPVDCEDLQWDNPNEYKNRVVYSRNNSVDDLYMTFSVVEKVAGGEGSITHDLVPNGSEVEVTDSNKKEYLRLFCERTLHGRISHQLEVLARAFHSLIPKETLTSAGLDASDLELLLIGEPDFDVDKLKARTRFDYYSDTSKREWLWRALKEFTPEQRAKFLQFVTGTSRMPPNGVNMQVMGDFGGEGRRPSASTCFNMLKLPKYRTYELMKDRLLEAIQSAEGFDLH